MTDSGDIWVFGYGSLIWRVDFPYAESQIAVIDDYARRFWQGSTDHRGVPGAPGRVLTLIDAPGQRCWGRAYRLAATEVDAVLAHLDHREKGGYERLSMPLTLASGHRVSGLTYRAAPDNAEFLGPAPIDELAAHIAVSHGPSGSNSEYVLELHQELTRLCIADEHISEVAAALQDHAGGGLGSASAS